MSPTIAQTAVVASTTLPDGSDPDVKPGFPVSVGAGTFFNSPHYPLVGNIDSDTALEIIAATGDGQLRAWKADGSPVQGWPVGKSEPNNTFQNAFMPVLGDLSTTNPGSEIVTQIFTMTRAANGRESHSDLLTAYSGSGIVLPGWPKSGFGGPARISPVVVDLNRDGLDEIIFWNTVYGAGGSEIPVRFPNEGAIAVGDLDGDGFPEISSFTGDKVYAYHQDGTPITGFPASTAPAVMSQHRNPSIGDVDGDGIPEILGILLDTEGRSYIQVVANDGRMKSTISLAKSPGEGHMPVLADMNCDGAAEIILETDDTMHVFKPNGTELPGWPQAFDRFISTMPVVGDVDGDGRPDLVTRGLTIPENQDRQQFLLAYDRNGNLLPRFPKLLKAGPGAAPAIADIDGDGRNEIILPTVQTSSPANGESEKLWVFDLHGPPAHGQIQWGQFGGGPKHQFSYQPDNGKCTR
jgi:hypothetical protein